jgi:hypothetical protein
MKRLLALATIGAGTLFPQDLKWWIYDVTDQTTACRVAFTAAGLYKDLRSEKVSETDLKSKFPNVGWGSGKIAASIVSTPREGDLVQTSLAFSGGNVMFRLVRERERRLTNITSRVFVVEIDRAKVSPKPTCTWMVDAMPAKTSPAPTKTTIRQ